MFMMSVWLLTNFHESIATICKHALHPLWIGRSGTLPSQTWKSWFCMMYVAAHCSGIFYQILYILLPLGQLMKLMVDVIELVVHAWTG